jgi:hypothetical protein
MVVHLNVRYVRERHAKVGIIAVELPLWIDHNLDSCNSSIDLAVHLMPKEVEALVIAKFLAARIFILADVLIAKLLEYLRDIMHEQKRWLSLHVQSHFRHLDI